MKKQQLQLGLVVEGNSTNSEVLRLRTLTEELGPIKSGALRVARRLSNFLHAGYAVTDYEDLQSARLILLRVPDLVVPRVVADLCKAELVFKNLSFVLCESWLPLDSLEALSARGSSIATLVGLRSERRAMFVVEGQTAAARQVRRFLQRSEAMVFEVHPGTKHLFFAADLLAATIPVPLLMTAQQALRASGLSGNHLYQLLEEITQQMFSYFLRGARTPWGGPLSECSAETANEYFHVLRKSHPHIAEVLDQQFRWATRKMAKQSQAEAADVPWKTEQNANGLKREEFPGA